MCTESCFALRASLADMRFDSKHNRAPPIILLGFSFAIGHRLSFFRESNILLSMFVQQLVAILVLFQEKMSTHPPTPPSLPISTGSQKKQENPRKTSTSSLLTMLKPLTVDHNKPENFSRDGNARHNLTCPLRNLYVSQEATLRPGMEQ